MASPEVLSPIETLSVETLKDVAERSITTILAHQHPESGIFPAATVDHRDMQGHYHHAWLRDNAIVIIDLNQPPVRKVYPPTSELGRQIDLATVKWANGMFALMAEPKWQERFKQPVHIMQDPHNPSLYYTALTDRNEAPPTHVNTDGSPCSWPTQDQPDAWGLSFSALALPLQQGNIKLDKKQKETLNVAVDYLARREPERTEAVGMWEWGVTHNPTPLSTVALCGKGFKDIFSFVPELQDVLQRRIHAANQFKAQNYPVDYTTPSKHYSKTDLATLVALAHGALDDVFMSKYFIQSTLEMRRNGYPGQIRFIGDHYYTTEDGKEAVWFMALPQEAIVLLRKANSLRDFSNMHRVLEQFRKVGLRQLQRALAVYDMYGIYPELSVRENGQIHPPTQANNLLWNHGEMAYAASLAVETLTS